MPLNYLKLQDQITQLGSVARSRQEELLDREQACRRVLEAEASHLKELQERVEQALTQEKSLRCAVPVSEPLDAHFAAPAALLENCTLLSADGSQIMPNPHEAVYYGLINVGLFQMKPGSREAPTTEIETTLIYEGELDEEPGPLTEELINLRRDSAERRILAQKAKVISAPLVTLTDGPLELYHQPGSESPYKRYLESYVASLQDLALLRAVTAGYVDRPRAALLVKLLELAAQPAESLDAKQHPFAGLSDLTLMRALLAPGERSAVFALQSTSAGDYPGRIALHFFYINVGSADRPVIARVEIPQWVAASAEALNLLHAALLAQSQLSGAHPYPYALLRAHETAVVKYDESAAIKELIQKELLRRGLPLQADSEKLANKKVGERTRFSL